MTVIAEIQVAPSPPGTDENPHAHVEAAIAVIQASGLRYEVGALGTTLEGEADEVWATLRAAHEAMLAAGAIGGISHIKVASVNRTIESLTSKFPLTRPGLPAVVTHADPSQPSRPRDQSAPVLHGHLHPRVVVGRDGFEDCSSLRISEVEIAGQV